MTTRCVATASASTCAWMRHDRVTAAAFSGQGCAISQASADLLTESVVGKTLDEVKQL